LREKARRLHEEALMIEQEADAKEKEVDNDIRAEVSAMHRKLSAECLESSMLLQFSPETDEILRKFS